MTGNEQKQDHATVYIIEHFQGDKTSHRVIVDYGTNFRDGNNLPPLYPSSPCFTEEDALRFATHEIEKYRTKKGYAPGSMEVDIFSAVTSENEELRRRPEHNKRLKASLSELAHQRV